MISVCISRSSVEKYPVGSRISASTVCRVKPLRRTARSGTCPRYSFRRANNNTEHETLLITFHRRTVFVRHTRPCTVSMPLPLDKKLLPFFGTALPARPAYLLRKSISCRRIIISFDGKRRRVRVYTYFDPLSHLPGQLITRARHTLAPFRTEPVYGDARTVRFANVHVYVFMLSTIGKIVLRAFFDVLILIVQANLQLCDLL